MKAFVYEIKCKAGDIVKLRLATLDAKSIDPEHFNIKSFASSMLAIIVIFVVGKSYKVKAKK